MVRRHLHRGLALGQGVFYAATGLWPIVSMRTFERVTGPKTDDWLVKTVGASLTVTGAALILGAVRGRVGPELRLLGAGSAAALGTVDAVYATNGTISKVYLADAVVEAAIVAAWLVRFGGPSGGGSSE